MSFEDAKKEVVELYHDKIIKFLLETVFQPEKSKAFGSDMILSYDLNRLSNTIAYKRIVHGLAYKHIDTEGFGGRSCQIFSKERLELINQQFKVVNKYIRHTGKYFSPSGGYDSYTGEYDYDPGGLKNIKTHIILELQHNSMTYYIGESYLKIEACNVEKIHEGNS